jgi:hypothetical protein
MRPSLSSFVDFETNAVSQIDTPLEDVHQVCSIQEDDICSSPRIFRDNLLAKPLHGYEETNLPRTQVA